MFEDLNERKSHWDHIYTSKGPQEVSWTQQTPQPSLDLIRASGIPQDAPIIDIGGGDSLLVDHLLDAGFTDITVLDISKPAIERAKERLENRAKLVYWITSDILEFKPTRTYELWHDRAAFHFLAQGTQQQTYMDLLSKSGVRHVILGTFSVNGPLKCSGLDIVQQSEESMADLLKDWKVTYCSEHDHRTPFGTDQRFLYGRFELA